MEYYENYLKTAADFDKYSLGLSVYKDSYYVGKMLGDIIVTGIGASVSAGGAALVVAGVAEGVAGITIAATAIKNFSGDMTNSNYYQKLACEALEKKPSELSISDEQLGKKWGKHQEDYPEMNSHTDYKKHAQDIFDNPDKIFYDATNGEYYFITGDDLLRVKKSGEFISLYPGSNSDRVLKALRIK